MECYVPHVEAAPAAPVAVAGPGAGAPVRVMAVLNLGSVAAWQIYAVQSSFSSSSSARLAPSASARKSQVRNAAPPPSSARAPPARRVSCSQVPSGQGKLVGNRGLLGHLPFSFMPPQKSPQPPVTCQQRVLISNEHGEKLVGLLHQTSSKKLVILCHGFRATKDDSIVVDLVDAFTKEGISAFRFDFSGNGESEGEFQYGSYRKEAADLRSVVLYFTKQKYDIIALVGHSKGGNAVLLYASKYNDVPIIVNISGRFALERGIDGRLGKNFMQRINKDGYIDVKNKKGELEYRVAKASLEDRLSTDTLHSSRAISKDCRVLTIHGARDEIVPAEDARQFAAHIPNHELRIMAEANHRYTGHEEELTSYVLGFVKHHLYHHSTLRPKL